MRTIISLRDLTVICFFTTHHFQHARSCIYDVDIIDWKFENESSLPASNVSITFGHQNFPQYCETYMRVMAPEVRDNLTIFVYAIPYVESELDCPSRHRLTEKLDDLRKHICPRRNPYLEIPDLNFEFWRVFTGCYYVVMRNDEGKNWIIGPKFHETRVCDHLNTKLTVKKWIVKPEDMEGSKELLTELKVPLPCIGVVAWLYEEKGHIDNVTYEKIKNQDKPEKQKCYIRTDTKTLNVSCDQSTLNNDTHLEIVRGPIYTQVDGEWTMVIKWTNLRSGRNRYFQRFTPQILGCYLNDDELRRTLHKWERVVRHAFYDLGYLADDNRPFPIEESYIWIWIWIELVIAVGVLAYWIMKFFKLAIERKRRTNLLCGESRGTFSKFSEEESNQILLIYVRSSNSFTEAMRKLRRVLTRNCQCRVHDLYATDEWDMVGGLGATGWVERLLRDGSKIVWIDTPQFRSWLNDSGNQHTANDFRDHAVPYAVSITRNLFQNATTQYRRHFVVRMEGFEVDDGQDDPLLVISPHARYCLPNHLPLLCEHLKTTPQSSENPTAEV